MAGEGFSRGQPFGAEYALLPRWNLLQRLFIGIFGVVDLPTRLRARLILRTIPRLCQGTILDIGAGTGSYAFHFSRASRNQVFAIDVDRHRVSDCIYLADRLARPNAQFMIGSADGDLIRFDSESMDLILAVEVLQYCDRPQSIFSEAYRLLKPGGHFLVHVPVMDQLRPSERILFSDQTLRIFARRAGLRCCELTPTFGGVLQYMCRLFEKTSISGLLTAIMYPFLLLASAPFSGKHSSGRYRLLVASKPQTEDEMKEFSF
jgi:SAM-dependent methyltransferase